MKTRKDLITKKCTFEEYYSQFVTQYVKNILGYTIGIDRLLKTKGDLSQIPLKEWDELPVSVGMKHMLEQAGDSYSISGKNCIFKTAAKQMITI